MTELLYSHSSIVEILKAPIIIIISIIMIPIIILISKKILPVEKSPKKDVKIIVISVFIVIIVFFGPFLFFRIRYAFDIATNNKVIIETILPNVSGDNGGDYFYYNKKRINFNRNINPTENLREHFVGELCEIEYYRFSGGVIRITLLE